MKGNFILLTWVLWHFSIALLFEFSFWGPSVHSRVHWPVHSSIHVLSLPPKLWRELISHFVWLWLGCEKVFVLGWHPKTRKREHGRARWLCLSHGLGGPPLTAVLCHAKKQKVEWILTIQTEKRWRSPCAGRILRQRLNINVDWFDDP